MKVWEKCNEVKGTSATLEQIAAWAYMNRICPLMFDVGLEIDVPLDEDGYPVENCFSATAHKVCHGNSCGMDCLKEFLNSELEETRE